MFADQPAKGLRIALCFLAVIAASVAARAAETYPNVFDYCAAVGTIDQADVRFTGVLPDFKVAKLFDVAPGALHEGAFVWRCMNGAVWVCAQLNSPICGKANISRVPTKAMTDYCQLDPDSAVIPMVVMGQEHPPAYDWACRQSVATVTRQLFTPDARGYPPDLWKRLAP
jgi:hypothetical protein